ncbi:TlyA family rRNA (cytidine-2'-O)-methyltransferase [Bifidobacterium sp. SMB2]|uniref:TlyA family rRNA (Cytidine-2'-O)-methyltransferase n=1 Tax=Bifidobacterium saimiriisciurei TaxID=2661627 RepID=A0ABX0CFP6_9BIFI|nr:MULTISPECIES: TlyA family RNA methyltransferase [Bifidobacterium]NEG95735.1 TlyA family rRNA (cytidine-2'-O)-methyltransferase [Bifidobacterium sp. SMB2]NEH11162.1 TlyA family rRNA (cytidine-2'-O)-methyltransferase [Bifidobacterium saimiriisciurei]
MASSRLDAELVSRGLADSRSRAQRLIKDGAVVVNGTVVTKPAAKVYTADDIVADPGDDYVSRGAYKLIGAYERFAPMGLLSPKGLDCLDIGASTGGFTEVLLRKGAAHVLALDVGHGQLHPRIADDPRVIDMSGTNIRDVQSGDLPFVPRLIVSDVSFISLTYVIPVIERIAPAGADVVLLVKPQFEVGREHLGRGGIVTDDVARRQAFDRVIACARDHGFEVRATSPSPITGTHGNVEYLLWIARA